MHAIELETGRQVVERYGDRRRAGSRDRCPRDERQRCHGEQRHEERRDTSGCAMQIHMRLIESVRLSRNRPYDSDHTARRTRPGACRLCGDSSRIATKSSLCPAASDGNRRTAACCGRPAMESAFASRDRKPIAANRSANDSSRIFCRDPLCARRRANGIRCR